MKSKLFPIYRLLLLALVSCHKTDRMDPVPEIQEGFAISSFEEANIRKEKILDLENEIETGKYNVHGILLIKNDKLIYERYFPGEDAVFPNPVGILNHTRDSLHDCRSITKSIVSICIGIAIQQGKIKSVTDPIFNYFPDYTKYALGNKSLITIRDLLTMSAGLEWNEQAPYTDTANSEINMSLKADVIDFVLSRMSVQKAGSQWNYSGGCTQLLAQIITNATGMTIDEYASTYFFQPLGIQKYSWFRRDPVTVWAPSGLRLRPIDMAKVGAFFLREGKVNAHQLISKEWINESLKWHINTDEPGQGYGYQFWCSRPMIAGNYRDVVMAIGNGGQVICMISSLNIVIILTAGNYDNGEIIENLLETYFFPAIQ